MNSGNYLICPSCNALYPREKINIHKCPICKVNLVSLSEKPTTSKRVAKDIESNSGSIILGDHNTINNDPSSNSVAEYKFHPKSRNVNILKLLSPVAIWATLCVGLIKFINTTGSIVSVLSILGFTNISQSKEAFNSVKSFFENKDVKIFLAALIVAISIYFIFPRFNKIRKLIGGNYVFFSGSNFFKRDNDNNIAKGMLKAKCPDRACSGFLTVYKAPENEQGVEIIGVCNKKPRIHTYDIDLNTFKGSPVTLSKKQKPKGNQAR